VILHACEVYTYPFLVNTNTVTRSPVCLLTPSWILQMHDFEGALTCCLMSNGSDAGPDPISFPTSDENIRLDF
jgi:hypothetical protein